MKRNVAQAWGDSMERGMATKAAKRAFQRSARATSAKRSDGLVVAAYLSVRRDGRIVQLHLPGMPPDELPKRGDIQSFSEASRRRLCRMLHSLRRDADLPCMVTLTFPSELIVNAREAKRCLVAWNKRMRREFGPQWCHVWRIEAHPELSKKLGRVHPHFHLLTWGAWYDFETVRFAWQEVVWEVLKVDPCLADEEGRQVKDKHRAAGTKCDRVRQWGGVLYSAKDYLGKEEEYPLGEDSGRIWGVWNRKALPMAEEQMIPLTQTEAVAVRIEVEAWMREKRIVSDHLVCTFFDDDPSMFVARLLSRVTHPQLCHPQPMPTRPRK